MSQDTDSNMLGRMQGAIPAFCRRHFSWRGAWRLNRHALGLDLLRAPVNVFYAPLWVVMQLLSALLQRLACTSVAQVLRDMPSGLVTQVQREVRSAIVDEIIGRECLATLTAEGRHRIELNLMRYQAARNAMADISANLVVLATGAILFGQFTPGGLSLGQLSGTALNQHWSIEQFWAGPTLGSVWYGWFPPDTPLWLMLLAVGLTLSMIALTAALSGLIMDPLQKLCGWHEKRLQRLVRAIHADLAAQPNRAYQPHEPFWARMFDALDWLRL